MSTDEPDDARPPQQAAGGAPPAASWQQDPFARHEQRWWDGSKWSDKVRTDGAAGIDPPGVVAAPEVLGTSGARAEPIVDAAEPLQFVPTYLPRLLLLGVVLLVAIVALVLLGIATA